MKKTVVWLMSPFCNLKCLHCHYKSHSVPDDEPDIESKVNILENLYNMGIHNLVISGGEPTIHKNFPLIYNMARKSFETVIVQTNGITRLPRTYDNTFIEVSLDDFRKDFNDKIRGLGTTVSTIKHILEHEDRKRVFIRTTVFQKSDFSSLLRFVTNKEADLGGIVFQLLYAKNNTILLNKEDIERFKKQVEGFMVENKQKTKDKKFILELSNLYGGKHLMNGVFEIRKPFFMDYLGDMYPSFSCVGIEKYKIKKEVANEPN